MTNATHDYTGIDLLMYADNIILAALKIFDSATKVELERLGAAMAKLNSPHEEINTALDEQRKRNGISRDTLHRDLWGKALVELAPHLKSNLIDCAE